MGAVAGALAPLVATTYFGTAGLGAGSNTVQYGITQYANGESVSGGGLGWSAITGAVGGLVGGRINQPATTWDTSGQWMDSALTNMLNQEAQAAVNTGIGNFSRNLGGATTGSIDLPENGSPACGCK